MTDFMVKTLKYARSDSVKKIIKVSLKPSFTETYIESINKTPVRYERYKITVLNWSVLAGVTKQCCYVQ